jgi:hypothetical protein
MGTGNQMTAQARPMKPGCQQWITRQACLRQQHRESLCFLSRLVLIARSLPPEARVVQEEAEGAEGAAGGNALQPGTPLLLIASERKELFSVLFIHFIELAIRAPAPVAMRCRHRLCPSASARLAVVLALITVAL